MTLEKFNQLPSDKQKHLIYRMEKFDEVSVMPIQIIVDLPEWQELRKDLVGGWSDKKEESLKRLKDFAGNLSTTTNRKLRIVQNYVTGSGFRMKKITSPSITEYQGQVKKEMEKRRRNGSYK